MLSTFKNIYTNNNNLIQDLPSGIPKITCFRRE